MRVHKPASFFGGVGEGAGWCDSRRHNYGFSRECRSGSGNKLSNVSSFIILRSVEGLIFFYSLPFLVSN